MKRKISKETRKKLAYPKTEEHKHKIGQSVSKTFKQKVVDGWVNANKGKTWEEILGKEKAVKRKEELSKRFKNRTFNKQHIKRLSQARKNKTYEQIYGSKEARRIKNLKSEISSGSGNPNWHDGRAFEPYGMKFNMSLKKRIAKRDSYICQLCKKVQNGKKHDTHHIDYNKTNNDPFNLLYVCASCHGKTNVHRETRKEYFIQYQLSRGLELGVK